MQHCRKMLVFRRNIHARNTVRRMSLPASRKRICSGRFRPPPTVSSMLPRCPRDGISGHSGRRGVTMWKTCGGVVIFLPSFAQNSAAAGRLPIAASGASSEHARALIGVPADSRQVRPVALRRVRTRLASGHEGSREPMIVEFRVRDDAARRSAVRMTAGEWTWPFGVDRLGECPLQCLGRAAGNRRRVAGTTEGFANTRFSGRQRSRGAREEGSVVSAGGLSMRVEPSGDARHPRSAPAGRGSGEDAAFRKSRLSPARNSKRGPDENRCPSGWRGPNGRASERDMASGFGSPSGAVSNASQRTALGMRGAVDDVSARGASHARSGSKPVPVRAWIGQAGAIRASPDPKDRKFGRQLRNL